ncbi:hypothetical protein KPL47_06950 [Clostridium estertheticum]|uniref:hypothetical protein n=1 Tax=Clostridium estertheticum TaxID=238834 RepID=UPI001C0BD133|nr:hypothetical protein [Clostridium estertheticum]MBU3176105.1 hypothetical protein [Clostridium estertheticum]
MTIISTAYVPEGIAMVADSRLTGSRKYEDGSTDRYSLSDNSQKIFLLEKSRVGISFCGDAIIESKTIGDFIRLFEIEVVRDSIDITDIANKLKAYLFEKYPTYNTLFHVCGYSSDQAFIYLVNKDAVTRCNVREDGIPTYGVNWNGEYEGIDKLINGNKKAEINFYLMPLKDAIDFVEFVADVVIKYQRFEDRVATCGGPIDILVITKDYAKFIKHKILNP